MVVRFYLFICLFHGQTDPWFRAYARPHRECHSNLNRVSIVLQLLLFVFIEILSILGTSNTSLILTKINGLRKDVYNMLDSTQKGDIPPIHWNVIIQISISNLSAFYKRNGYGVWILLYLEGENIFITYMLLLCIWIIFNHIIVTVLSRAIP